MPVANRHSRAPVVRALLALAVLLVSLYFALTHPARLGLDLRGGTQITLEAADSPTAVADSRSTDRALEVLRKRVDALGVAEPTLVRSGEKRIIVELPGMQDPREAAKVIGRTAQLSFHSVLGAAPPGATPTADQLVLPDESGQPLLLSATALTGEGVGDAAAQTDPQRGTGWFVTIDFKGDGAKTWAELTGKAACATPTGDGRRVAIVLDGRVISSPAVDPSVACGVGINGGSTQITGRFTAQEAKDLAVLVQGGALPIPMNVVEQRTVGATLGAAAISASALAAAIGVGLTALFLMVVYRLFGGLAAIALAGYALISYAALVAIGATLTLPGLAGFVLAIGMAVDANVLVFERAREEYADGARLLPATKTGFTKAWTAIMDSNVTTLLAAGLLFFLSSGPVKGFGVTLSIGVLASMVSALLLTRVLVEWAAKRGSLEKRPAASGIANLGRVRLALRRRNPDLMRHGRRWLGLSAIAVVLAGAGILTRGLDYGVEFTGGRLIYYTLSQGLAIEQARAAVAEAGQPRAVVQTQWRGRRDPAVRAHRGVVRRRRSRGADSTCRGLRW